MKRTMYIGLPKSPSLVLSKSLVPAAQESIPLYIAVAKGDFWGKVADIIHPKGARSPAKKPALRLGGKQGPSGIRDPNVPDSRRFSGESMAEPGPPPKQKPSGRIASIKVGGQESPLSKPTPRTRPKPLVAHEKTPRPVSKALGPKNPSRNMVRAEKIKADGHPVRDAITRRSTQSFQRVLKGSGVGAVAWPLMPSKEKMDSAVRVRQYKIDENASAEVSGKKSDEEMTARLAAKNKKPETPKPIDFSKYPSLNKKPEKETASVRPSRPNTFGSAGRGVKDTFANPLQSRGDLKRELNKGTDARMAHFSNQPKEPSIAKVKAKSAERKASHWAYGGYKPNKERLSPKEDKLVRRKVKQYNMEAHVAHEKSPETKQFKAYRSYMNKGEG